MSDSYDWVLIGFAVIAVTVFGYRLCVQIGRWRQDSRTRRRRRREFL